MWEAFSAGWFKPVLINNTIAYNSASNGGGGIACGDDSDPILINNILFGNTAPNGSQVLLDDAVRSAFLSLRY